MFAAAVMLYLVTGCAATFGSMWSSSSTEPNAYNLCVYSKDPTRYKPNCFTCPVSVYPTAMQACVNATDLPSNITYSSASCLEMNCAINFPKASTSKPADSGALNNLLQQAFSNIFRAKRSVGDNVLDDSAYESPESLVRYDGFQIVGGKKTFASELEIDFDYMT